MRGWDDAVAWKDARGACSLVNESRRRTIMASQTGPVDIQKSLKNLRIIFRATGNVKEISGEDDDRNKSHSP
jgi:hypothetical protein